MNILIINPWIYDFAAYDLWMKPLGVLYIARILKSFGFNIYLIDCMDRLHPLVKPSFYKPSKYGCGHYYHEEVEKPHILKFVPRKYKRYGMKKEVFIDLVRNLPKPQIILVSSGMTYWYLGVIEIIKILKIFFPNVPVILGGTYPTLCNEHAKKYTSADYVFCGDNIKELSNLISDLTKVKIDSKKIPKNFAQFLAPYYELYHELEYIALRTSVGCIFNCSYCAVSKLTQKFIQKDPKVVADEIEYFYSEFGVKNFAFYDDALLFDSDNHIIKLLNEILKRKIKCYFHTPNGLHARFINKKIAELLYNSGFINPRLGFETVDKEIQKNTGNKVTTDELISAIDNLKNAGYKNSDIIVYIMFGMPTKSTTHHFENSEKEIRDLKETIEFLQKLKVRISLSEYSPIPHTYDWKKTGLSLETDPLLHNNSVYYLYRYRDWQKIKKIKDYVHTYNWNLQIGS